MAPQRRPLALSEKEALALLTLCLTSPTEFDLTSDRAVNKLARYCKTTILVNQEERQSKIDELNRILNEEALRFRAHLEAAFDEPSIHSVPLFACSESGEILWTNSEAKALVDADTKFRSASDLALLSDAEALSHCWNCEQTSQQLVFRAQKGLQWYLLRAEKIERESGKTIWLCALSNISGLVEVTGGPELFLGKS